MTFFQIHKLLAQRPLATARPNSRAIVEDVDERSAELLMTRQGIRPAQFVANVLHAVANSQHRDSSEAMSERARQRCQRSPKRGPPGTGMIAGRRTHKAGFRREYTGESRIDPALAHPARDQLGHGLPKSRIRVAVGHGMAARIWGQTNPSLQCAPGVALAEIKTLAAGATRRVSPTSRRQAPPKSRARRRGRPGPAPRYHSATVSRSR